MRKPKRLTPKIRFFAERYAAHSNGARAMREAGSRELNARQDAYQALQRDDVQALIEEIRREVAVANGIDVAWTVRELHENVQRAIAKNDPSAVNGALQMIGKWLGMFTERHEMTGKDGGPIEVRVTRRIVEVDPAHRITAALNGHN